MYMKILSEEDLVLFRPQKKQLSSLNKNWQTEILKRRGLKLAIIKNKEIIAVLGLKFDVYLRAWLILSENANKYLLSLSKFFKNTLKEEMIFIYVENNWDEAKKWANMLGFVQLKEMPLENYSLWARKEEC